MQERVPHVSVVIWRALFSHLAHGARVSHRLCNKVLVSIIVVVLIVLDICSRLSRNSVRPVSGPMEAPAQKKQRTSLFSPEPFYLPSDIDIEELLALRDLLIKRLRMLEEALEARRTTTKPSCEHVFRFCQSSGPRDNNCFDDRVCTFCGCYA